MAVGAKLSCAEPLKEEQNTTMSADKLWVFSSKASLENS